MIQYNTLNMTRTTENYLPPECEYEVTSILDMLCQSPKEGGMEGTEDEEWTL